MKVLITGGSRGIGFELSKIFINNMHNVIICGKNDKNLLATRKKLPSVQTFCADLKDPRQTEHLSNYIRQHHSDLDILVNNAAIMCTNDLQNSNHDGWRDEYETNLLSPIQLTLDLIPYLMSRSKARIVNITTILVHTTLAQTPYYCSSKAALHIFTQALRHQLRDTTIKVIEVQPPSVDTEMTKGHSFKKITPAHAATEIYKGIIRGKSEIMIGNTKTIARLSRLAPKLIFRVLNSMRETSRSFKK